MTCLFLREGLHVVFEFFDRDIRVGSSLLLRFDDLVQLAQLRVKPRQRRTLLLQPALRLAVFCLSGGSVIVVCVVSSVLVSRMSVCTHLALRDFVCERSKLLAHFVDPCRGVGERLACRGDVRLDLFCIDDGF